MRIQHKIEAQPVNSANPSIIFPVNIEYDRDKMMITRTQAYVIDKNGTILSKAEQYYHGVGKQQSDSIRAYRETEFVRDQDSHRNIQLYASFSPHAIEKIESNRLKNPRRDVEFTIRIVIDHIQSNIKSTPIVTIPFGQTGNNSQHSDKSIIMQENPQSNGSPTAWFLKEGNNYLLQSGTQVMDSPVTISSSDWIYKFSENMKIGKTCLFEIPIPELDVNEVDSKFSEYLVRSIETFHEMEKNFKLGEWNAVVQNSRPIFELLRDKEKISEIMTKSGYTDEMATAFFDSTQGLFSYASKYIHALDKKRENLMPSYVAEKEDAYMIYTASVSLINLINNKLKKINSYHN